jgi:hypothetical protein
LCSKDCLVIHRTWDVDPAFGDLHDVDQLDLPHIVVSSPNFTRMPKFLFGPTTVRACLDGRYGLFDISQYPQRWSRTQYPHRACVQRRPQDPKDPLTILWYTPKRSDFIPLEGTVILEPLLGRLSPDILARLYDLYEKIIKQLKEFRHWIPGSHTLTTWLEGGLRNVMSRLCTSHDTFRDLVLLFAEFSRLYLDLHAKLQFETNHFRKMFETGDANSVDTSLMGAYTSDPAEATMLFTAGIPVWLLRNDRQILDVIIRRVVLEVDPIDVETAMWYEPGRVCPFPAIFRGLPGEELHYAVSRYGAVATTVDIDKVVQVAPPHATVPPQSNVNATPGSAIPCVDAMPNTTIPPASATSTGATTAVDIVTNASSHTVVSSGSVVSATPGTTIPRVSATPSTTVLRASATDGRATRALVVTTSIGSQPNAPSRAGENLCHFIRLYLDCCTF